VRIVRLMCMLVAAAASFAQTSGANLKAEEAAIRALIANPQRIKYTDDRIFWSGAYKRPIIGAAKGEPFSDAALGQRKNQVSHTEVQRIEVAASGDMAYEFSNGKLEYDVEGPSKEHVSFETASVRVWKKVAGEWKVALMFVRPME
jgi:ketosteroid isomerase-like protein